jgi:hypothetical protein
MKIEFDEATPPPDNQFLLTGIGASGLALEATPAISPALAVWSKWRDLMPETAAKVTIQGPAGFCSSFHYQIAAFIAYVLIVLQEKHDSKSKIGHSPKPLDAHQGIIRKAGVPDFNVFGYGLAQLASYAQAEWTATFIPCPLEQRLRSLFVAIHRISNNEPARQAMVTALFECALCVASHPSIDSQMLSALNVCSNRTPAQHPSSPRLEGIFDNWDFTNDYWLESLVEHLKVDRDAYKRDAARATKDYSVLVGVTDPIVPIETIRIESPESLLFDLWAWQDCESSKEHRGFPLVWIDSGWMNSGFELHLDPSKRESLKPLAQQVAGLGLPDSGRIGEAGWCLTYPADSKVKSDVRYGLKKKLFPEGADFKAEYLPVLCASDQSHPPRIPVNWKNSMPPIEQAIRDSELECPKKQTLEIVKSCRPTSDAYLWAEVEFAEINTYKTWAGDEIATILYSLLRPAPEMTLPNDFLAHHVHRCPGMVCTWAREGIVVAHYGDRESRNTVEALKKKILVAAKLEGELEYLMASTQEPKSRSQTESRKGRVKDVVKEHLCLRQSLAEPELRPLRGFLERRHAQEIYDAFRQFEADANQLKTMESMERSSGRLDWLEAVLFAFAITEAGHILGEALLPGIWVAITVGTSIAGVFAAVLFLLLPNWEWFRKCHSESIGKTILIVVFAFIYIGALILSWFHPGGMKDPSPLPANSPIPVCMLPHNPMAPSQPIPASVPTAANPAKLKAATPHPPIATKP